ncbi:hypothetical protein D9619_004528 [Psilocybe cf. subviscida]|uniref:Nephrocystin 3-like N-terminal domain-containing protein n=1 Tax=Psilocybe cf. subviscida TaxID=2480587 RepID=A0A8H5F7Z0_9AGAR|nr:hypothetical protein D9619_004528 [Psilocybe cf. subviscida]
MATVETIAAQVQQTSDIRALKTSLIDSDKLVVTGGSFNQLVVTTTYNASVRAFPGLDILRSAISISAMHDARGRFPAPRCFRNTYVDIKETALEWSTKANQPAILCFTGGPKTGKSAIAHEIAETLASRGTLAGSFFFEADKKQDDGDFFLTLAYQIAIYVPGMDQLVNAAVLRDPTILKKRGEVQLTKLILEPLFCLPTPQKPFTVVVDGFDQCNTIIGQMEVTWLIARASLMFGDTLRFLIFARRDGLDLVLGWNNFYWVGRHIPLNNQTSLTSTFRLYHLADRFFDPCPSSVDTINKMWLSSSLIQSEVRNTSPGGALMCTNAGSHDVALSHFSGSPMSVDLLRRSPHGMAGSPMVIDSLRSSPATFRGSPMLIDSIYLSHGTGCSPETTPPYTSHQRLGFSTSTTSSPCKLTGILSFDSFNFNDARSFICGTTPGSSPVIDDALPWEKAFDDHDWISDFVDTR